jgi:Sec-independent protein secretion pathway component TatC
LGLVFATPVIIYQILAFIQPLMRDTTRKFLLFASAACGTVAILGILFGYFIGLPQALHFLLHQFVTVQVRPLITIQSYMQFVALYLLGSALMFQIPLILLFINRIKPLKPKTLFKYERHLVIAAVIIAFIMNPSPNIVDQLFVVLPIIVTYQVGILLIWAVNHGKDYELLAELRAQDAIRQAERAAQRLLPFTPAPLEPELATDPIPIDTMPQPFPAEPESVYVAEPAAQATMPAEQVVVNQTADETSQPQRVRPRMYASAQPMRRSYLPLRGHIIQ